MPTQIQLKTVKTVEIEPESAVPSVLARNAPPHGVSVRSGAVEQYAHAAAPTPYEQCDSVAVLSLAQTMPSGS